MVNAIADSQKAAGKSGPDLYTLSSSIMTGQTPDPELREYQPTVSTVYIALARLWVGLPFAYGLFESALEVKQLFR